MMEKLEPKFPFHWEERKKFLDLPFPLEEYHERVARIREALPERGLDGLLVYGGPGLGGNVRYVSNFNTFFGITVVVMPHKGDLVLVTNAVFHGEPMHTEAWKSWVEDFRPAHFSLPLTAPGGLIDLLADTVAEKGLASSKVGLVGEMWWPQALDNGLRKRLPHLVLSPASELLANVKAIKSSLEVDHMRRLAAIGDAGLKAGCEAVRPGLSELEVAADIHHAIIKSGAEEIGGEIVVVSGKRAGFKHVHPSEKEIKEGEMVFIDLKACYHGYYCDIARSLFVGRPPEKKSRMLNTALHMADASVEAIKPGQVIGELAKVPQKIAEEAGFGQQFMPTALGHGVGTARGELPKLFPWNEARFQENMVFSLEPMLVEEGLGTACVEDMIRVTAKGAERMTNYNRRHW